MARKHDPKRQRSVNLSRSAWEKIGRVGETWRLSDSRVIEIMVLAFEEQREPAADMERPKGNAPHPPDEGDVSSNTEGGRNQ